MKVFGKLGCVGRFTVALQAAEHDDGLTLVLDDQAGGFLAAHQGNELFVDDLDHLLGGGQALHDLLTMARSETWHRNPWQPCS